MNSELQSAIAAIKSGDKEPAYQALVNVIKADPSGDDAEIAWLWMSAVVDSPEQKRKCLETVLSLNPHNESAIRGLAKLGAYAQSEELAYARLDQAFQPGSSAVDETQGSSVLETDVTDTESQVEQSQAVEQSRRIFDFENLGQVPELIFPLTVPQLAGLVGALLLVIGVFVPIISLPLVGNVNYFRNGSGDGVIVLILALFSVILILARRYRWLWITSGLALGLLTFTLLNLILLLSEMEATLSEELAGNMFAGLAELAFQSVQIEWGWVLLFLGVLLVLIPAFSAVEGGIPWKFVGAGVVAFGLVFLSLWLLNETGLLASTAVSQGTVEPDSKAIQRLRGVPAGEEIEYESGSLRILQAHNPIAYHVIESGTLGVEGAERVPGMSFVGMQLEFLCSQSQVLCDTVPEASLELLLEDGRLVEDDEFTVYDAPHLGDDDVASGRKVTGWRVFHVPQDAELDSLIVKPFGGQVLKGELPGQVDGFEMQYGWEETESTPFQLVAGLRRDLIDLGYDPRWVIRLDFEGEPGLTVNLCEDVSFYIDDRDAIDDYEREIIDVVQAVRGYREFGEDLYLAVGDCSSLASRTVTFIMAGDDLERLDRNQLSRTEFLDRLYVSTE